MAGQKKRPTEVGGLAGPRGREGAGRQGARSRPGHQGAGVDAARDGFLVAVRHNPSPLGSSQGQLYFEDKWIYCSPTSSGSVAPILTPGGRIQCQRREWSQRVVREPFCIVWQQIPIRVHRVTSPSFPILSAIIVIYSVTVYLYFKWH